MPLNLGQQHRCCNSTNVNICCDSMTPLFHQLAFTSGLPPFAIYPELAAGMSGWVVDCGYILHWPCQRLTVISDQIGEQQPTTVLCMKFRYTTHIHSTRTTQRNYEKRSCRSSNVNNYEKFHSHSLQQFTEMHTSFYSRKNVNFYRKTTLKS